MNKNIIIFLMVFFCVIALAISTPQLYAQNTPAPVDTSQASGGNSQTPSGSTRQGATGPGNSTGASPNSGANPYSSSPRQQLIDSLINARDSLQQELNKLENSTSSAGNPQEPVTPLGLTKDTGYFGPMTKSSISSGMHPAPQKGPDFGPTGYFGPKARSALSNMTVAPPPPLIPDRPSEKSGGIPGGNQGVEDPFSEADQINRGPSSSGANQNSPDASSIESGPSSTGDAASPSGGNCKH